MPRPLKEQVVVITGAAAGIGRTAALAFAEKGAAVVLADHNRAGLDSAVEEIERQGGAAYAVQTDVAEWEEVERLAQAAVEHFGRIDTWINNAALSEYAMVEDMTIDEIDRIVQVNLMGQIYGMKAALPHMIRQGYGNLVSVASALAYRSIPLQSAYCATKHGIKGFTEALRMELRYKYDDIHVTLVMPASINTPLFAHARSKMGRQPMPVPPIYQPEVVAEALLHVAEHPIRDVVAGGAGKLITAMGRFFPAFADWYMVQNGRLWKQQLTNRPADQKDNLFSPMPGSGEKYGEFTQRSKPRSLYTRYLGLHPNRERALIGTMLLSFVGLIWWLGRQSTRWV